MGAVQAAAAPTAQRTVTSTTVRIALHQQSSPKHRTPSSLQAKPQAAAPVPVVPDVQETPRKLFGRRKSAPLTPLPIPAPVPEPASR